MSKKLPKIPVPSHTLDDVAFARSVGDVTSNGVAYFTKHSDARFHFILARERHHTDGDMFAAKVELQGRFDMNRMTIQHERVES